MKQLISSMVCAACVCLSSSAALAVEYHFCVSSDKRPGNVITTSSITDFGHDWYQVKTAQSFCQANGASGCSASDFNAATCGHLREERLDFYSASGDQVRALFSGDPLVMGQATVEIVTGVTLETAQSVGNTIVNAGKAVVKTVCGWLGC